jgi:hypothetical protein
VYTGNGSSFVVSYKGTNYLISNYHVITAGLFGVEYNNKFYEPEVLRVNDFEDIAVLSFPGIEKIKGIEIDAYEPKEGEEAFAIGYPGVGGSIGKPRLNIANGLVSNSKLLIDRGEIGVKRYIQLSVPANPGNSGGPVFNETGKLIGMVALKWLNLSSVSAAIPNADIINEINQINKSKTITKEYADKTLKSRMDLIAISINEMDKDVLEFGFHYSPSFKLKIYPFANEAAERVVRLFRETKQKYPNDSDKVTEEVFGKLNLLDTFFGIFLFEYLRQHPNENIDQVIDSPFRVTELYLAASFYTNLVGASGLERKDIDFTKYKFNKITYNEDKTKANVDLTIFLTKKSFNYKLDFVREWGIWFLVPTKN